MSCLKSSCWLSALLLLSIRFNIVFSDESDHYYNPGDGVLIWVNKVGPFNNPTETYPYYNSHVPFCARAKEMQVSHNDFHYSKFDGLGSLLEGNQLVYSGIPMKFLKTQERSVDCTIELDFEDAHELASAIQQKYWYQMFIDDLPVWGMVGEYLPLAKETAGHHHSNLIHVDDENFDYDMLSGKRVNTYPHIFTHKAFSISHNNGQVIEVNLTSEDPVLIRLDSGTSSAAATASDNSNSNSKDDKQNIKMTYSIKWIPTNIAFHRRFDRYLDFQFFEHQIHWFALFNSFMLVIFLVGMVSMVVLRALKKDLDRINAPSNEDGDDSMKIQEETVWKKLHGDVFRAPAHLTLFSAIVGTGWQVYTATLLVILLAISGKVYDTRGTIITSCVSAYAVTALVSGYSSAQTYLNYSVKSDPDWKKAMALTGLVFPSIVFAVTFCLNLLSVSYQATNAVSFWTFCVMFIIWLVSILFLIVGSLVGRSTYIPEENSCAIKSFIHPLPLDRAWYMHPVVFCVLVGVLPFGSIFIEMYYIFNSFWNYKFYYVYGFMLLVFLILTVVTACVTIVATYILLNAEDRRWKWVSIFSGGSTALYVFCYATFYYYTKTQMNGLFQTSFYFGYMFLFSLAIFFMCATIGYTFTAVFVKKIYANIHTD